MKRVLIIKLWALGDLLMATPLVSALQAKYPGIEITWLADNLNAELLEGQPGINVARIDSGFWRRKLRKGRVLAWLKEARFWQRELGRRKFDAVINCHPDLWWTRILCAAPGRLVPSGQAILVPAFIHGRRSQAEADAQHGFLPQRRESAGSVGVV